MKKALYFIATCLVLTGCSSTPGTVASSTSKFDGTQQVSMEPGWVYNGMLSTTISLGGFWNTKMGDDMVMQARYQGTESISGIAFNIDGEIVELKPSETFTQFETKGGYAGNGVYTPVRGESTKQFTIPLAFAKRLVEAKKVMVRLDLSRSFAEGEFRSGATMAKPAFVKFLAQVEKAKLATK